MNCRRDFLNTIRYKKIQLPKKVLDRIHANQNTPISSEMCPAFLELKLPEALSLKNTFFRCFGNILDKMAYSNNNWSVLL